MNEKLQEFLTKIGPKDTVAFFLSSGSFIAGNLLEYDQNLNCIKISMTANSFSYPTSIVKEFFVDTTKIISWGKSS